MAATVVFRYLDHSGHGFRLFADAQPEDCLLAHPVACVLRNQPPQDLISPAAPSTAQPESGLLPQRFRLSWCNKCFQRLVRGGIGVQGDCGDGGLNSAVMTFVTGFARVPR